MSVSPASGSSLAVTVYPSLEVAQTATRYLVEWDTAPAVPEVQTVTTSIYTGPNAAQVVSTHTAWAPEVQIVRTLASPLSSVQTVTTSAALGEALTGSFTLLVDLTPFGGGVHTTGNIMHDAVGFAGEGGAANRTSLGELLSAVPGVGAVDVSRSGPDDQGGYAWNVTFTGLAGDVPLLALGSSSLGGLGAAVGVLAVTDGAVLGGSFTLSFRGFSTAPLAFDATPAEMERGLGELPPVDAVSVSRWGPDALGGFVWAVTFVGNGVAGDVPSLLADGTGLSGAQPRLTVCTGAIWAAAAAA